MIIIGGIILVVGVPRIPSIVVRITIVAVILETIARLNIVAIVRVVRVTPIDSAPFSCS